MPVAKRRSRRSRRSRIALPTGRGSSLHVQKIASEASLVLASNHLQQLRIEAVAAEKLVAKLTTQDLKIAERLAKIPPHGIEVVLA